MRLTERKLKQIIHEEIKNVLNEDYKTLVSSKVEDYGVVDIYFDSRDKRKMFIKLGDGNEIVVEPRESISGKLELRTSLL